MLLVVCKLHTTYVHNLYGHLKSNQFFIFNLKAWMLSGCFIAAGTKSHIFGPKNDSDWVPWYTEWTWRFSKASFLRTLYQLVFYTNVSLKISGNKPRWVLNIFVAKTWKFLWCIETELHLFKQFLKYLVLSWYVISRPLSCI